jgi:hypothetical protein
VSGVLAHKSKKERLKPPAQAALFLCSTLSMLDNRPELDVLALSSCRQSRIEVWGFYAWRYRRIELLELLKFAMARMKTPGGPTAGRRSKSGREA